MNTNIITQKIPLEDLLTPELFEIINATAMQYFVAYGKKNPHCTMITQEDLASQGYYGATLAYQSFDPGLGINKDAAAAFSTFAFMYIRDAIGTYCRKFSHTLSISTHDARKGLKDISSIGVIHINQLDEDHEFDIPVGSGMDAMEQDDVDYLLLGLTDFERSLLTDHVLEGYSTQELSERYNMSKSRAAEVLRDITDRMRTKIESNG